jgi:hypothetical protein
LGVIALLTFTQLQTGCGSARLETGYQPNPIGTTNVQRRAFYSGPFSPEARQAQIQEIQERGSRRPSPGY